MVAFQICIFFGVKIKSPNDCNEYFETEGPSGVVAFTAYAYILGFYGNQLTDKLKFIFHTAHGNLRI